MTKGQVFIVGLILLLGLILRLHNYAVYPQRGASSDEYTYSFLGVSLLKQGIPISWSAFRAYKNREDLTIDKLYFPIVWPYFDHPPLNGLLLGGWAILRGEDNFLKIKLSTVRLVPIFLAMASSLLLFLIAQKLYNYQTALWTLLIFSTTTIFAISQRVVFAENLLTPIFLLAIYLFVLWRKKITTKKALVFGVLAGLAFWTKEAGITLFLALFFLFVTQRLKPRLVITLTLTTIFFLLLYLLYGVYYDKELFFQIISAQADRNIGPQTLLYLLSTPIIVNKVYLDGWYFFGLLAFFYAFGNFTRHKFMLIPAFFYFMFLIFSLTQRGEMGWYMLPLFPFMALFSADLIWESIKNKSWFIFIMLLFVGLSQVKFLFEENFGLVPIQFRVILFLMFGPFILLLLFKKQSLFTNWAKIWFYLLILGNIILTYTYIHPA